eukprot:TRINITY_DN17760_c0_g1_i1.p1 TRINITY_DN17760_c0_g1~~TRINITY_DN17760_c0_g1_i1.p1  ORF type:complete len:530 (+),score=132.69 TRINITY_DN17760_c0_g1_i1:1742-3331(+)
MFGVKNVISVADCLKVLSQIRAVCASRNLTINEVNSICRMITFIAEQADRGLNVKQLVIPDENSKLVPFQDLLYNDSPVMAARVDKKKLHFVNHLIPFKAVTKLNIPFLSHTIREVPKQIVRSNKHSEQVAKWNVVIHSKEFAQAVQSLWVHQLTLNQQFDDLVSVTAVNDLEDLFSGVTIELADALIVRYFAKNVLGVDVNVGQDVEGTSVDVLFDRAEGKLYVSSNSNYSSFEQIIARALWRILNSSCVFDVTPIESMLSIGDPTQVFLALDSLGLKEFSHYETFLRGVEGQVLLNIDQDLCEFSPNYNFRKNEIVAWKDTENSVFRYGRIVEETRDQWNLLAQLKIVIGPGKEAIFLSSDVWHFQPKPSTSRESKFEEKQDNSKPVADSLSVLTEDRKSSVFSENRVQPTSSDAAALVQGVQSMLSRVGLPISLDAQEMMSQNLALKAELSRTQEERMKLEIELKTTKDNVAQAFQCAICQNAEVDHVLDACGHTVCAVCLPNLGNKCPYCRAHIKRAMKFFKPAS